MPFGVKHDTKGWIVYNQNTGRILGTHATKVQAVRQLAAVTANYNRKGGKHALKRNTKKTHKAKARAK